MCWCHFSGRPRAHSRDILRASVQPLRASDVLSRRKRMQFLIRPLTRGLLGATTILACAMMVSAQQSDGPQTDAPPPVAPPPAPPRAPGQKLTVPSGTRLAVV